MHLKECYEDISVTQMSRLAVTKDVAKATVATGYMATMTRDGASAIGRCAWRKTLNGELNGEVDGGKNSLATVELEGERATTKEIGSVRSLRMRGER